MTSGALNFAVRHAALVEALEECAPPVDNTYLGKALRRMKLPIAVSMMGPDLDPRFNIRATDVTTFEDDDIVREVTRSPKSATAAYFDLVSLFSSAHSPHPCADAPTPLGAAAGASPAPAAPISDPVAPSGSLPVATATSPDATATLAESGAFSLQASS